MIMRILTPYCLLLSLMLAVSCHGDDPNAERKEYIRVYAGVSDKEPLASAWLPVRGGSTDLYVKSNVSFSAKWQDGNVPAWASITGPVPVGDKWWKITVSADSLSKEVSYVRRTGVLMLTAPEIYLGNYFVLHQGLQPRISCDFSWLSGSQKPNETVNDVQYDNWSNSWKGKGFTSSLIEGQEGVWVYSKEGYVKLGNSEGVGADLLTPHTGAFQYDSLLVLSFKAVVQNGASIGNFYGTTDPVEQGGETGSHDNPDDPGNDPDPGSSSGTEPITPMSVVGTPHPRTQGEDPDGVDNNSLTVEVTGGGVIRDYASQGRTSIKFNLTTYDRKSPAYPADIFRDAAYLVFICSTPSNPIGPNTTVRFIAGDMSGNASAVCSRIFIDDIYVYRTNPAQDEDIFVLNDGRSGRDLVLGGTSGE